MRRPSGVSSRWTSTSYQRSGIPASRWSPASSTSTSARALSKYRRHARSRSEDGVDKDCSVWDCSLCNCSPVDSCEETTSPRKGGSEMTVVSAERASDGYSLGKDEG